MGDSAPGCPGCHPAVFAWQLGPALVTLAGVAAGKVLACSAPIISCF